MQKKWYHNIRFEYQRWPLSRLDLNFGYIWKSIAHMNFPHSEIDAEHYKQMTTWIKNGSWRTSTQNTATRLCAVGDVMWIRSGWENALSRDVTATLSTADMIITNLETPIDPSQSVPKWVYETFHYNAPVEYLTCWHKFTSSTQQVFSICNNHALDQGYSGLEATRTAILQQGSQFHCLGGTVKYDDTRVIQINNITVGLFASTFGINHLSANDQLPAGISHHLFGRPQHEPDWDTIALNIRHLKNLGAEYIVYTPHWGYEYEYWPAAAQRNHALKLIQLGVDLIIGHSPHVLQPVELVSINNKDIACPLQITRPGKQGFGVIAWSLGNFLTIMPTIVCKTGAILQLDLVKTDREIQLKNLSLLPTYTTRPPQGRWLDRQVMCLNELPNKKKFLIPKILIHCQKISPLINIGDF